MIDSIRKRVSVRAYIDKPIEEENKRIILNLLSANTVGAFGSEVRFELVDLTESDKKEIKSLGTYGFIKGASLFIAGAVKNDERAIIDYGFCLEKVILNITNMGLGTCWLGGAFKKSNFAKKIGAKDDEAVPAITPVGYISDKHTMIGSFIKFTAKSRNRKQWSELFFNGDIDEPLSYDNISKYSIALESVRLAPSSMNIQPWRIIKEKERDIYHFYLKDAKKETPHMQCLNIGIAMCHFELSAVELELTGKWETVSSARQFDNIKYISSWVG